LYRFYYYYYYSEQTWTILTEIHGVPTRGSVGGLRVEGGDGVARGSRRPEHSPRSNLAGDHDRTRDWLLV